MESPKIADGMTREQAREIRDRSQVGRYERFEARAGHWLTPSIFCADVHGGTATMLVGTDLENSEIVAIGTSIRADRKAKEKADRLRRRRDSTCNPGDGR